jgi:integrase/recombinase XerD
MAKNLYIRGETYWARFKVAGQEFRRSLYVSSEPAKGNEAKARRALGRLKEEIVNEIRHGITPPILWQQAVIAWHEGIRSNISDQTFRRYLVSLNQCSRWLEDKPISEIDGSHLRSIVKARRLTGATNATIKRDLTAISSVLNAAIDEDWIEVNHTLMLNRRRIPERRDPITLPTKQSMELMRKALTSWLADMMELADATGMRQDEIVRLEWSVIRLDDGQATLHKTKRKKVRTIELTERAIAILMRQPRSSKTDLVFWHSDGRPYEWVSSRFGAVARKVAQSDRQFVRFRFHDLRHNFAVRYLREQTGSLHDLQKLLGHRSIKTTEQYLEHLTPAQQRIALSGEVQKTAQHQRFNNESDEENG